MARLSSRTAALSLGVAMVWGGLLVSPGLIPAEDKVPAELFVMDALVSPNQEALIRARLESAGGHKGLPAAGEPLELMLAGKVVGTAVTDGSGQAVFRYTPKTRGSISVTVRAGEHSRVSATATATVAAWERRTPLLAVELASLEKSPASGEPLADAADELGKLTLFYYHVLYVVPAGGEQHDAFRISQETRQWLSTHKFPLGHIVVLPSIEKAFGPKLDELRAAGWSTLKVGVGRSRQFAETFLQRRLDAVMVPEPAKGEQPRKAKVAKEWKEVRKKL